MTMTVYEMILEVEKPKDNPLKKYVGLRVMKGDRCIGAVVSETEDLYRVRICDAYLVRWMCLFTGIVGSH